MKRKPIALLCAASLAACLCACAQEGPGAPSAPSGASASAAAQTDGQDAPQAAASGALRALTGDAPGGVYFAGENGGHALLCYVDAASAAELPLCAAPACAHEDESCTAWLAQSLIAGPVYVDENTIAFIAEPSGEEGGTAQCVMAAEPGGAGRRVLYTAQDGQWLQTLAAADETALYVILAQVDGEMSAQYMLYRVPLDGGEAQALRELPQPVPTLLGVYGRSLVLYQYDFGSDDSDSVGPGSHRVFLWDVDTGEQTPLGASWASEPGSAGRALCWSDGRLYWCADDRPGDLYWLEPDGAQGQAPVEWPEEIAGAQETAFSIERVGEGHALVTVWGLWGTDLIRRYAVDVENGGAAAPVALQYTSNASERPVRILGACGGELLAVFDEQTQFASYLRDDGSVGRETKTAARCGFITWQDLLAGRPNYREVAVRYIL